MADPGSPRGSEASAIDLTFALEAAGETQPQRAADTASGEWLPFTAAGDTPTYAAAVSPTHAGWAVHHATASASVVLATRRSPPRAREPVPEHVTRGAVPPGADAFRGRLALDGDGLELVLAEGAVAVVRPGARGVAR